MLPCRYGVHGGRTLTSSPSPRYSLGWSVWYVSYILPCPKMIHDLVFLSLRYVRTALILYLSRSSPAHNMPSAWCHRRLLSASTILFASRSALTTAPAMLPRCSGSVCSPAKSSLPSYSGFDSSRKSALDRPWPSVTGVVVAPPVRLWPDQRDMKLCDGGLGAELLVRGILLLSRRCSASTT